MELWIVRSQLELRVLMTMAERLPVRVTTFSSQEGEPERRCCLTSKHWRPVPPVACLCPPYVVQLAAS